jgi:metal-sulfur cluster biosynthetic enzyme
MTSDLPGAIDRDSLAAAVRNSLRTVIDPELGENVVDLGLVYFVAVDDAATAHVVMTTTTPGCPAVGYLKDGVARAASGVEGVAAAEVAVTYDPPWSPDMMSDPSGYRRPAAKPRFWRPW